MAVPQTPPRVIGGTPPAVLTGLCGTIKTVALLGCCSILRNIMSSRILTSDVIGIDVLYTIIMLCWRSQRAAQWRYSLIMRLPFYAVTPARMAELLALEEKLSRPGSDVALDAQFYEEPEAAPVAIPCGKFAMYPARQPDADFSVRLPFGAWRFGSRSPQKSWRRLSPTGRRKVRFFTISSGSKAGAQRANQPFQQWRNAAARHQ